MSKIVENAGITRSSLYRHLPPRPVVTQTAQDIRFVIGASDFFLWCARTVVRRCVYSPCSLHMFVQTSSDSDIG